MDENYSPPVSGWTAHEEALVEQGLRASQKALELYNFLRKDDPRREYLMEKFILGFFG